MAIIGLLKQCLVLVGFALEMLVRLLQAGEQQVQAGEQAYQLEKLFMRMLGLGIILELD